MVSPQAKKKAMETIVNQHEISQRRACKLVSLHRSVGRYVLRSNEEGLLKERIIALAHQRKRFGYRRILILLKNEGLKVNQGKGQA